MDSTQQSVETPVSTSGASGPTTASQVRSPLAEGGRADHRTRPSPANGVDQVVQRVGRRDQGERPVRVVGDPGAARVLRGDEPGADHAVGERREQASRSRRRRRRTAAYATRSPGRRRSPAGRWPPARAAGSRRNRLLGADRRAGSSRVPGKPTSSETSTPRFANAHAPSRPPTGPSR